MICPNCGRELPDTARVCPSCNAVQRINKRRRAEADVEESAQRVPVSRRVSPEQAEKRRRQREQQGSPSTPERADAERVAPQGSKMPVGLYRQEAFQRENVRHVRHVPSNTRRKVDAAPAMYNPPIYRKTNRKLLRILFVILLMAIGIVSAAGYMLVKTEDGQQLMAQWGWKMARTDAYVTLGKEGKRA